MIDVTFILNRVVNSATVKTVLYFHIRIDYIFIHKGWRLLPPHLRSTSFRNSRWGWRQFVSLPADHPIFTFFTSDCTLQCLLASKALRNFQHIKRFIFHHVTVKQTYFIKSLAAVAVSNIPNLLRYKDDVINSLTLLTE